MMSQATIEYLITTAALIIGCLWFGYEFGKRKGLSEGYDDGVEKGHSENVCIECGVDLVGVEDDKVIKETLLDQLADYGVLNARKIS